MDWRKMFDANYVGAWDLHQDRDTVMTIESVTAGQLLNPATKEKSRKAIIKFRGAEKLFACNKTNANMIAKLFGTNETSQWIGKRIALYPTKTQVGRETKDCIRVRPRLPNAKEAPGALVPNAEPSNERIAQEARLNEEQQPEAREPGSEG